MGAPTLLHRSLVTSQWLLAQRGACSSPATWPPGQGAWIQERPGHQAPPQAPPPPGLSQLRRGGADGGGPQPVPGWGVARTGLRGGCWAQVARPGLAGERAEVAREAYTGQKRTPRGHGARTPALTPALPEASLPHAGPGGTAPPASVHPTAAPAPGPSGRRGEAGCGGVPRDPQGTRLWTRPPPGAGREWARLRTGPRRPSPTRRGRRGPERPHVAQPRY